MDLEEIWRPIKNYEGYYEISNLGNVKSIPRYIMNHSKLQIRGGIYLKHIINKNGYPTVNLSKNNKQKTAYIHRLIMEHFSEKPLGNYVVCHRDDIKTNFSIENLYWGTEIENSQDKIKNGNMYQLNKVKCLRGHELVAPNLKNNSRNKRECLSCSKARSKIYYIENNHNIKFTTQDFQNLSDAYYEEIMRS